MRAIHKGTELLKIASLKCRYAFKRAGILSHDVPTASIDVVREQIRRFLKDHYKEAFALDEALQLGVRALTVTQNKTLSERDLEVAVLDRTKERRKFRRIPAEALAQLLATAK